ncbi:RNA-binding (RRM/RBD/RNP motifs) family protein [Striga asiatica]|uniref:RNA-binding (RRM/RBD/RNP motifs) family protein n=1 Tax=Striga asiatica TaxID=4170 RepID=A0A5A7PX35_STRAF|nr:RNA-binding (RRM/RBD/RNP motifs) family protein [Striga asiatica]
MVLLFLRMSNIMARHNWHFPIQLGSLNSSYVLSLSLSLKLGLSKARIHHSQAALTLEFDVFRPCCALALYAGHIIISRFPSLVAKEYFRDYGKIQKRYVVGRIAESGHRF